MEENILFELVDVLDGLVKGIAKLLKRALDNSAVALGTVALSLNLVEVDLTGNAGGGKSVGVASAGGARKTAETNTPLLLLGLGLGVTLDGLVEGLGGLQNSVALATLLKALVLEDFGVVLLDEIDAALHPGAGDARVAAKAQASLLLLLGLGLSGASAGNARVATQARTTPNRSLSRSVGVTLEDGLDGGIEGILDVGEGATSLVAGHAREATETLAVADLGLGGGKGVRDGEGRTLRLVAGHAGEAAETLAPTLLGLGLGVGEDAGGEGQDGQDGAGDLHVGVEESIWFCLVCSKL